MLERVNGPTKGILDNCALFGEFIFRKHLNPYSHRFEEYPKGWIIVPGIGMLCPKCSEKYNKLVEEFVAKEKTNE